MPEQLPPGVGVDVADVEVDVLLFEVVEAVVDAVDAGGTVAPPHALTGHTRAFSSSPHTTSRTLLTGTPIAIGIIRGLRRRVPLCLTEARQGETETSI